MKKLLSAFTMIAAVAVAPAFAQGTSDRPGARPTAPATQSAPAKPAGNATLPNGANSLAESYGDWSVNCETQNGVKACAMIQQQTKNDQMWLTVNIAVGQDGNLSGVVILPFGVLVSKPITFQIDETNAIISSTVRTCAPVGCIVPIALDRNLVAGMRNGKSLKIGATSASAGEEKIENMAISLNGFGTSLDRVVNLSK